MAVAGMLVSLSEPSLSLEDILGVEICPRGCYGSGERGVHFLVLRIDQKGRHYGSP